MTTSQGQDTCINSKHFEEMFSQQKRSVTASMLFKL